MSRVLVASSSQLFALLVFARRIPPPTPTFHEAGTVDTSLRLPDLASPSDVRTLQRQPPIRDLNMLTFPAVHGKPKKNGEPGRKVKVKGTVRARRRRTTMKTKPPDPKQSPGHVSSDLHYALQRLRRFCNLQCLCQSHKFRSDIRCRISSSALMINKPLRGQEEMVKEMLC